MSDDQSHVSPGGAPTSRPLTRRQAFGTAWGSASLAGLALAARPAAPVRQSLAALDRLLDDPVAGMRPPATIDASSFAASGRRGRPGFRPKAPLPLGTTMGGLSIPSVGLDDRLREGIDLWVLDQGPGHWAGSAMPGEVGNCIIAGHRVSHTRPFYDIDAIPVGETMVLSRAGIDHVYVATSRAIVSPTDTGILDPTPERTATIFACHPRGSISQRFVVTFTHA